MNLILPTTVRLEGLEDYIGDDFGIGENLFPNIFSVHFLSILTSLDKIVILMIMGGFSQREIAEVLRVSEGFISQRVKEIRLLGKVLYQGSL
jgi:DNA-binding NarL/FixJ family response regulator